MTSPFHYFTETGLEGDRSDTTG